MSSNKNKEKSFFERLSDVRWEAVLVENGQLSKGRLMGWVVFGILIYFWISGFVVPPSIVETFWGLLIYNASKKVRDPLKQYFVSKRNRSIGSGSIPSKSKTSKPKSTKDNNKEDDKVTYVE